MNWVLKGKWKRGSLGSSKGTAEQIIGTFAHSRKPEVYTLFEEELEKNSLVTSIDDAFDFDRWTEDFFHDGQFVRTTGTVRLIDYSWISTMLEALPKMMSAAEHAQSLALKQKKESGLITEEQYRHGSRELQKTGKEIKDLGIHQITELIKQLYGDVVRLKLLPSREHPNKAFAASADPKSFHDTTAALSQKYGYEIDAGWVALGQINMSRDVADPQPIPIGNKMEDSFELVALGINNLIRFASAVRFPAVSLTPISIYRTC